MASPSSPARRGARRSRGDPGAPADRGPAAPNADAPGGTYVVVRGPLGVGKTTAARELARRLGALYVSIDAILEDEQLEEWDEDRISLRSFLYANRSVADRVGDRLRRGATVVVDGNFYWKEQLVDLARRLGVPGVVFRLEAPVAVCLARDRRRPLPSTGRGPRAGDRMGARAVRDVYRLAAGVPEGLPVDATGPSRATVAAMLEQLRRSPHEGSRPPRPEPASRRTRERPRAGRAPRRREKAGALG